MFQSELERRTVGKVTKRLVPYLFLLYVVAYIDRANVGYAALQMNTDLGLDPKIFGLLAGVFFIGYFLFEVPSNILLHRFGARIWIARIMVTWGIVVVLIATSQDANHLFVFRFLLGFAEAGFFPGIVFFLTNWFNAKNYAKIIAMFMAAIPFSFVIGAPLSTWIMDHVNFFGWAGWRWMFILEGIPAIILGFVTFFYLTDTPEKAKWLTDEERKWLVDSLNAEKKKDVESGKAVSKMQAIKDPRVWVLALVYFLYMSTSLGVGFFLPTIIKELSITWSATRVGLTIAVPYLVACFVMYFYSKHSDKTGERWYHTALPLFGASLMILLLGFSDSTLMSLVYLFIFIPLIYMLNAPFWAIPPLYVTGPAAAVGIAWINSVGGLGGFVGPYVQGFLKTATGGPQVGYFVTAAYACLCAIILLMLRHSHKKREKAEVGKAKA